MERKIKYLNADNISAALKFATTALKYLSLKGTPIDRLETYSLRPGEANVLLLTGFSNRDIQNMGRCRGGTFK